MIDPYMDILRISTWILHGSWIWKEVRPCCCSIPEPNPSLGLPTPLRSTGCWTGPAASRSWWMPSESGPRYIYRYSWLGSRNSYSIIPKNHMFVGNPWWKMVNASVNLGLMPDSLLQVAFLLDICQGSHSSALKSKIHRICRDAWDLFACAWHKDLVPCSASSKCTESIDKVAGKKQLPVGDPWSQHDLSMWKRKVRKESLTLLRLLSRLHGFMSEHLFPPLRHWMNLDEYGIQR